MEEKKLMEFKHPKYYKELRKLRNNLDQAISGKNSTECKTRSPGSGLKQQAPSSTKEQASSTKLQAFEPTCSIAKRQASQSE